MKTGQISEYPNLNEILDPAVVNALYEGGYKQKKDSVPVLWTSNQTEYRNTCSNWGNWNIKDQIKLEKSFMLKLHASI